MPQTAAEVVGDDYDVSTKKGHRGYPLSLCGGNYGDSYKQHILTIPNFLHFLLA
jgi:hypothetical protein